MIAFAQCPSLLVVCITQPMAISSQRLLKPRLPESVQATLLTVFWVVMVRIPVADRSLLHGAKVTNAWSFNSTP